MQYTQLSTTATPGRRYSSPTHTGTFTALSVMATPGMRHTFAAKTLAAVVVGDVAGNLATGGRIYEEDQEILRIVKAICESGMLN